MITEQTATVTQPLLNNKGKPMIFHPVVMARHRQLTDDITPALLTREKIFSNIAAQLKNRILQHPTYQELQKLWSEDEVLAYMLSDHQDSEQNSLVAQVEKQTLSGLSIDYHERYELREMQRIVDAEKGDGYFARAIANRRWEDVDAISTQAGRVEVYLEAHRLASRAEIDFLHEIITALGFKISKAALFIAHTAFWFDRKNSKIPVFEMYLNSRRDNFGLSKDEEDPDYPVSLSDTVQYEILEAEHIFKLMGDTEFYSVLPSYALDTNGWKESPKVREQRISEIVDEKMRTILVGA